MVCDISVSNRSPCLLVLPCRWMTSNETESGNHSSCWKLRHPMRTSMFRLDIQSCPCAYYTCRAVPVQIRHEELSLCRLYIQTELSLCRLDIQSCPSADQTELSLGRAVHVQIRHARAAPVRINHAELSLCGLDIQSCPSCAD